MTNANCENLKLDGGCDENDAGESEVQRVKRIRNSDIVRDLPTLQRAYDLAKSEPPQPRTYALTNAERVLFGLPVNKR